MPVSDRARMLLCGLALAAAAGAQAQANFREAYARGKEAAANGRWSEVEARMREAIAAEPTPQARVRIYGMRFEPYVPQYFLGLAAYRQGDCGEAQRQWTHAATAAILAGDATLRGVVEQGLADCRTRQPQLAQQPAQPPARPTPDAPTASAPAPRQPVAQQQPVTQQPVTQQPVTQQPVTQQPVTQPARPAAQPAVGRPTTEVAQRDPPAPARPNPPAPTPQRPAAAPPSAPRAPPALVAALEAFLAGRLDVAANLDLAPFADGKARYHALLLRSAARHALSLAGDERAEALLAGAQADIRAARALLPGQAPDAGMFSPRYRRLFDATR